MYNLHNLNLGFATPKQGGKFPAQLAGRAHQRINSTGGIAFCFAKQGGKFLCSSEDSHFASQNKEEL